jgi:hypothetical protein
MKPFHRQTVLIESGTDSPEFVDMGRSMTAEAGRLAFGELVTPGLSQADLEQHKLDRLLELRAVIDALRVERADELLSDARASMASMEGCFL